MPEVVNPAVIIGLGGTGKWVLTYVKKNLLDTYGGEMPKTVRLLSFDTTSEKISRDGVPQEEDARVGNVQLDKQAEFVYLGGNIQQICREVRDEGRHPHIRSWLQARTYLQTADSDAFDISRGAGQKRQLMAPGFSRRLVECKMRFGEARKLRPGSCDMRPHLHRNKPANQTEQRE